VSGTGPELDTLRDCLEGAIPAIIATCGADGMPNVSYVSQVHYVDAGHVALSFQFFNKTRRNVLENPGVTLLLTHPGTGAIYQMQAQYLRTETAGPLFESMRAKLAGIASHTGMTGVFRLRGSDVYRAGSIVRIPGGERNAPLPRRNLLAAVRQACQGMPGAADLESLFERSLEALSSGFDIRHAMILLADEPGTGLYAVASRGYERSGVGSEIRLGEGVIGMAARECTAIRINYSTTEYAYGRAMRDSLSPGDRQDVVSTEIPFPGLPQPGSQLAVPIAGPGRLLGVLYVEDPEPGRFSWDHEDALVAFAGQLGTCMQLLKATAESSEEVRAARTRQLNPSGKPLTVRRYAANDSVFLGEDYLIKGVAGAIFWKLVVDYVRAGRTEFTNRELRLDPSIRLPEVSENLEARLILLERRLAERGDNVRIEKTGRGRFRLVVRRPLELAEIAAH